MRQPAVPTHRPWRTGPRPRPRVGLDQDTVTRRMSVDVVEAQSARPRSSRRHAVLRPRASLPIPGDQPIAKGSLSLRPQRLYPRCRAYRASPPFPLELDVNDAAALTDFRLSSRRSRAFTRAITKSSLGCLGELGQGTAGKFVPHQQLRAFDGAGDHNTRSYDAARTQNGAEGSYQKLLDAKWQHRHHQQQGLDRSAKGLSQKAMLESAPES